MISFPNYLPRPPDDPDILSIGLDDRFYIFAIKYRDGWSWAFYDEVADYHYTSLETAKDQTTVILLATELIRDALEMNC